MAFAEALKLSFAILRSLPSRAVAEGRHRYRQMIEEASAEVLSAKSPYITRET